MMIPRLGKRWGGDLTSPKMYKESTQRRSPVKTGDPERQFLQCWRRQTRSLVGVALASFLKWDGMLQVEAPAHSPVFFKVTPLADHSFVIQLIYTATKRYFCQGAENIGQCPQFPGLYFQDHYPQWKSTLTSVLVVAKSSPGLSWPKSDPTKISRHFVREILLSLQV